MKTHNVIRTIAVSLAAWGLTLGTARSVTLPVLNGSFEQPTLAVDTYTTSPSNWAEATINGPLPGFGGAANLSSPPVGQDGSNIGFLHHEASLEQTVFAPIETNTAYYLSLGITYAFNPPTLSNLEMRLVIEDAGTTNIPTLFFSSTPALTPGTLVPWTFGYYVPADGMINGMNVLGKNWTIQLINNDPTDTQIRFDSVMLETPEPSSVLLLGLGMLVLGRRIKTGWLTDSRRVRG